MIDIYIVDDPPYKDTRLEYFPPATKVYNKYAQKGSSTPKQDMMEFCRDLGLLNVDHENKNMRSIIAFLHLNNSEAMNEQWSDAIDWPNDGNASLIGYVIHKVCKIGGRCVIFSGTPMDRKNEKVSKIDDFLNSQGYVNGYHYAFIPLDCIDKSPLYLKKNSPIASTWRVDKLDKSKQLRPSAELIALNILSRVYISIKNGTTTTCSVDGNDSQIIEKLSTAKMNLIELVDLNKLNDNVVIGSKNTYSSSVNDSVKWSTAKEIKKSFELLCGRIERISPDVVTSIFMAANKQFNEILEEISLQSKHNNGLERVRNELNHNLIRNTFLNKIANARADLSIRERSEDIIAIWNAMKEKKVDETLAVKEDDVRKALQNWQEVYQATKDFFECAPSMNSYSTTEEFKKVKNDIIKGPNSRIAIVSRFIDEFDQIAFEADNVRNKRLVDLFDSIDYIQLKLSDMRVGGNFEKYFYKAWINHLVKGR